MSSVSFDDEAPRGAGVGPGSPWHPGAPPPDDDVDDVVPWVRNKEDDTQIALFDDAKIGRRRYLPNPLSLALSRPGQKPRQYLMFLSRSGSLYGARVRDGSISPLGRVSVPPRLLGGEGRFQLGFAEARYGNGQDDVLFDLQYSVVFGENPLEIYFNMVTTRITSEPGPRQFVEKPMISLIRAPLCTREGRVTIKEDAYTVTSCRVYKHHDEHRFPWAVHRLSAHDVHGTSLVLIVKVEALSDGGYELSPDPGHPTRHLTSYRVTLELQGRDEPDTLWTLQRMLRTDTPVLVSPDGHVVLLTPGFIDGDLNEHFAMELLPVMGERAGDQPPAWVTTPFTHQRGKVYGFGSTWHTIIEASMTAIAHLTATNDTPGCEYAESPLIMMDVGAPHPDIAEQLFRSEFFRSDVLIPAVAAAADGDKVAVVAERDCAVALGYFEPRPSMTIPVKYYPGWRTSAMVADPGLRFVVTACSRTHVVDEKECVRVFYDTGDAIGQVVAHGFASTKNPLIDYRMVAAITKKVTNQVMGGRRLQNPPNAE